MHREGVHGAGKGTTPLRSEGGGEGRDPGTVQSSYRVRPWSWAGGTGLNDRSGRPLRIGLRCARGEAQQRKTHKDGQDRLKTPFPRPLAVRVRTPNEWGAVEGETDGRVGASSASAVFEVGNSPTDGGGRELASNAAEAVAD